MSDPHRLQRNYENQSGGYQIADALAFVTARLWTAQEEFVAHFNVQLAWNTELACLQESQNIFMARKVSLNFVTVPLVETKGRKYLMFPLVAQKDQSLCAQTCS